MASIASTLDASLTEDVSDQITVVVDVGVSVDAVMNKVSIDLEALYMQLESGDSLNYLSTLKGNHSKIAKAPLEVGWLTNSPEASESNLENQLYMRTDYEISTRAIKTKDTCVRSLFINYNFNTFS